MKKSNVIWLIIALIVIIAAVAAVGYYLKKSEPTIIQGTVECTSYKASSKIAGRIEEMKVEQGQQVTKGELLYVLSTPELDAKLRQAEAVKSAAAAMDEKALAGARKPQKEAALNMWQKAQAGKQLAQKTFERVKALYEQGVVPAQKYDEAEANYRAMEATEMAAKAQYDLALDGASKEEKKAAVKEFNFPKGIAVALLCGLMSACFAIGLAVGGEIRYEGVDPMFETLPATLLVTLGGFATNAVYCFVQNTRNRTWGDYLKGSVWMNNLVFCLLAGALWYSQFFGLSLGKGFLTCSPALLAFAWCILMALNVVFSNVWGIILKEWKGCGGKTVGVLVAGIVVLIVSTFLPQLLSSN